MQIRVQARGPATRAAMWDVYADPSRWATWAPQIRRVRAAGPLRPGLEGEIFGWLGIRAAFRVVTVDGSRGRWSWEVRSGPARFLMEHEVSDGYAAVLIHGPPPFVVAYAPVAHGALARLVRLKSGA